MKSFSLLQILEATGGGTARHVADLCEALVERGVDVHLIYSPLRIDHGFQARIDSIRGLHAMALPMERSPGLSDFKMGWEIRQYLKRHDDIKIVHGQSSKGGALAVLAALGLRRKVIFTPHDFRSNQFMLSKKSRQFYRLLERFIAMLSTHVIVVSPEEEQHAKNYIGIPAQKISMVPNGVKLETHDSQRAQKRSELGLGAQDVVMGFVGRMVESKGVDLFLEAFARIASEIPTLKAVIVGDGVMRESMQAFAQEKKISDRVMWLGNVKGDEWMAVFDFYVMPSHNEGMPYVLLEALQAGLPILTTRIGGSSLVVEEGVNGFIIPTNDVERLTARMRELASDSDLRVRLGAASRERLKEFSVERMVEKTLAVYGGV